MSVHLFLFHCNPLFSCYGIYYVHHLDLFCTFCCFSVVRNGDEDWLRVGSVVGHVVRTTGFLCLNWILGCGFETEVGWWI